MHPPKLFHKFIYSNFSRVKIFIKHIISHFQTDFKALPHLLIGLFLSICIYFNYFTSTTRLYDQVVLNNQKSLKLVLYLFLFYTVAFIVSSGIISFTSRQEKKVIFNVKFIVIGLIGLFLLSVDSSYYLMQFTKEWHGENPFIARWLRSCFSNLSSLVTLILPLFILYYSLTYFKPERYGLRLNGAKIIPYFWLILFMIPLIYVASFSDDFLKTYPTYTDYNEYTALDIDQWITAGIYELCYGFDFLSVELFFRGFMVIALSRFVGKEAILPMITVYCFLHFGKPAGEAISSIFGGYILGILAFRSRNIYGGLIAHLGVAWGMDWLAFLNK